MRFRLLALALLFPMVAGCRAADVGSVPATPTTPASESSSAPVPEDTPAPPDGFAQDGDAEDSDAQDSVAPASVAQDSVAIPTHQVVPPPPQPNATGSTLWVALADHLGGQPKAPVLRLQSAAGPLTLRDARGREWTDARLTISWRSAPLDTPLTLARQVAGPFASFESADRVARRWRTLGVEALVAHPGEWEVWAPLGSAVPDGLRVRQWSDVIPSVVKPVFEAAEGGITLEAPVQIEAPQGLRWKGGVYGGPFRLQADAYGSWTLVEQVPLERYLEGVVPHEIGAGSPAAALRAQTVLARTWALANSHRFRIDGYHLCSDTQCQVYSDPRQAGAAVRQAIAATTGRLLSWQGTPISAVYHATNGGVMAAGPEAWAMDPAPYLKAELDGDSGWVGRHRLPMQQRAAVNALLADRSGAYGADHPLFRWTRSLTATEIRQALGAEASGLTLPLELSVLERGASGRVLALQVAGSGDALPVVLRLDRIRRTLRRLPSTLFVIDADGPNRWFLRGGGFGHGAGLSQAGAIDLAWRGWTTEAILAHYYPGTVYGPLPAAVQSP